MIESVFELETGTAYQHSDYIIVCHKCGKTFSPVNVIVIPTYLCMHYSGTYKRLCAIYYLSHNVCEHVMFPESRWGSIFLGDVESLPLTILSKYKDIIEDQPEPELISKAWEHAFNMFKERSKLCGDI